MNCIDLIVDIEKEAVVLIIYAKNDLNDSTSIDLFRGACAVKGNVQVAGHVKRVDNGAAFNA